MIFRGLLCLVLTGLCWVAVGVVVSSATARQISLARIQLVNAAMGIVISLVMLAILGGGAASREVWLLTVGAMIVSGAANFFMVQQMGKAMKIGPNGIIWGLIQSGLVFPFIFGMLFFGVEPTFCRILGICLIVGGISCFSIGKQQGDSAARYGAWQWPALSAFLLVGLNQCAGNLPSYLADGGNISSIGKTLFVQSGVVAGWLCAGKFREKVSPDSSRRIFSYAVLLTVLGLISSYVFFFRGLDLMAGAGAGSVGYPVAVGACIGGFFLYSLFVLHEKPGKLQCAGAVGCLGGIVTICL